MDTVEQLFTQPEFQSSYATVPVHLLIKTYRYRIHDQFSDFQKLQFVPLEQFTLYILWGFMDKNKEYCIKYRDFISHLGVNTSPGTKQILSDDIKKCIEKVSKQGLFTIVSINTQKVIAKKRIPKKLRGREEVIFSLNELRLLLNEQISYTRVNRLLRLLLYCKFHGEMNITNGNYSLSCTKHKTDICQALEITLPTLSRYLCKLQELQIFNVCEGIVLFSDKHFYTTQTTISNHSPNLQTVISDS